MDTEPSPTNQIQSEPIQSEPIQIEPIQAESIQNEPIQNDLLSTVASKGIQASVKCKGIRSTEDFPKNLSGLSAEQIEHHYLAMRNSHAALNRSRGQLMRRSREFSEARERFLATLRSYEERLLLIGQEKAEALNLAQDMHRELEAFENKQQQLDKILSDLDEAKQEAGFWSIFQINQLLERMRTLLRGGDQHHG